MAKAMRVDVVPLKYFTITAVISVLFLLAAIIIGATGISPTLQHSMALNCLLFYKSFVLMKQME